jgi:hypothetical protein
MDTYPTAATAVLADNSRSLNTSERAEDASGPGSAGKGTPGSHRSAANCSMGSEASGTSCDFSPAAAYTLEDFDIGAMLGRGKFGTSRAWRRLAWRQGRHFLPSPSPAFDALSHPCFCFALAGQVFKVREKKTKTILAMKVMSKKEIKVCVGSTSSLSS